MKVESVHNHEYSYNKFLVKLKPNWVEKHILGQEEKEVIVKKTGKTNGFGTTEYLHQSGERVPSHIADAIDKATKIKKW